VMFADFADQPNFTPVLSVLAELGSPK